MIRKSSKAGEGHSSHICIQELFHISYGDFSDDVHLAEITFFLTDTENCSYSLGSL